MIKSSSFERKFKYFIPRTIKHLILPLFINSMVGKIIRSTKIKWGLYGGVSDYSLVNDLEAARIFWGIWESAEIRFAKRFAHSQTVIELGSSVGVTLGVLSKFRKNTTFICVEASPLNFDRLTKVIDFLPEHNRYIPINKAISYNSEKINFEHFSTTGAKISEEQKEGNFIIESITLSRIISEQNVKADYTLITDIEGAEAEIFFEDQSALKNCVRIIAELEDTSLFSKDVQIQQLEHLGFSLTERYNNVVVMSRA